MCNFIKRLKKEPPIINRFSITSANLGADIKNAGITQLYGMLDYDYFYTDDEGLAEALSFIYLNEKLPEYSVDADGKWNLDCEDFALWLKAMVSLHFGINSCGLVIGNTPQGTHGFNLFKLPDGYFLWEPNPGFNYDLFPIGGHGYVPKYVLI